MEKLYHVKFDDVVAYGSIPSITECFEIDNLNDYDTTDKFMNRKGIYYLMDSQSCVININFNFDGVHYSVSNENMLTCNKEILRKVINYIRLNKLENLGL